MDTNTTVETIDTHTAGEPTRIILSGYDETDLHGLSVPAQRDRFADRYDWLREFLMCEPRGHDDMFGAVPTEPATPAADLGLFFMDSQGYLDMCGHGTMGAITALIETDRLEAADELVVETPAGLVRTAPTVADGHVESVAIRNVDSFVYETVTATVELEGRETTIPVDLVSAGNLFGLVDVEHVGLSVDPENVPAFVDLGMDLRAALNAEHTITNPFTDRAEDVSIIEFYEPGGGTEGVDRNVVVFGNGQVDRSPCGTGTCAKMTLLYDRGELALEEPYPYESVIGTRFTGRLLETRERDGYAVTTPEVTGSAYITGRHSFVRDGRDGLGPFSFASRSSAD
ncbi:proline racemase family protein [Natrialbaceae archaeon A-chndr2]